MIRIYNNQFVKIENEIYNLYLKKMCKVLLSNVFAESMTRLFPNGVIKQDLNDMLKKYINQANQIEIQIEADVTPYVFLQFYLPELNSELYLENWISAIINDKANSSQNRLNAIYEILPFKERNVIFIKI